jgi:hypothetical protein
MGAIYNTYRIASSLFSQEAGVAALVSASVLPSLIIYGSTTLRAPLILFIITQITVFFLSFSRSNNLGVLLYTLPLYWFLWGLRIEQSLIVAAPMMAALVWRYVPWKRYALLFGGVVLPVVLLSSPVQRYLDWAHAIHAGRAYGNIPYLVSARFDTVASFAFNILPGSFYALFAPAVWQLHRVKDVVPFVESVVMLGFALVSVAYLPRLFAHLNDVDGARFLLLYLLMYCVTYGVAGANVGTAYRHRTQVSFVLIVFGAPAMVMLRRQVMRGYRCVFAT